MTTWDPRANDLFLKARELRTADERREYLDRACAGEVALRAEVQSLLEAGDQAGSFLEEPVAGPVASGRFTPAPPDEAPVFGQRDGPGVMIGRYKLLEQIGEGGMGTVYMAQQTEPVKRLVALKLIKPGMDTRQVVARFEAERQALAIMDHPNIAKVFDGGTTGVGVPPLGGPVADRLKAELQPAGRPYFVMELVKGVPITDYCDQNQLTPRQRLELFIPVCQAVQHAHQKGIIHRDLKPSNVLVSRHDTTPIVKVIDFGVAKALGQELTDKTLFTGIAQMVGTPLYMSPEQAGMSDLDVDTRSDIYSLGILLYELLTGTTPFDKERFKTVGYDEMRRIIREEEPPRPSTRISTLGQAVTTVCANRNSDPSRLRLLLRGELDWIVMKALEKDRNRRYETANSLASDVLRYLSDEPVQACPPSATYRVRKFVRRNKGSLSVAAGLLLAVTVMAASFGWAVGDRAARQATVAVMVRDSLSVVRTFITENKLAAAREKLAEARAQMGTDRSSLADLAAEVEAAEAELNRFQQFLDRIDRAHQAETAQFGSGLMAGVSRGRAGTPHTVTWRTRRRSAAVPFLLEALQEYGVLEQDDWTNTLEAGRLGRPQVEQIRRLAYEELVWLADDVLSRRHDHRSERLLVPDRAAREALVYLDKAESAHPPTRALYALRARCHKALGDERAAQADTQLADQTPATTSLDHVLFGKAAFDAKQLAEGVQAFEAALRLEPTHYWSLMWVGCCLCELGQGPEEFGGAARAFTGCILKRPDHAHAYYCRGNAYFKLRQYDKAVADYTRAIELDPKSPLAWGNRGLVHSKLGQPDKELADYTRAIELDPKSPLAWGNRGAAHSELGQLDKALADLSQSIELDSTYASAWQNRGITYTRLGQPDKALADYSKAIELDPSFAQAWYNRGLAYNRLGQPDKALVDYSKAIELDPSFAQAWYNRGLAYNRLGQPDKALADFSKVIELEPKSVTAWYDRGLAYNRLGQPDKALVDYSKAIELNPTDPRAWINRGVTYQLQLSQPEKAVADYSKAIELNPKFARAWYNRGLAYISLGQLDKALSDHSRVIELEPTNADVWYERGTTYSKLGQPDKAIADLSKAIELNPKRVSAWTNRGVTYQTIGQSDKAVADLSKAIELNPKHASAWTNRGVTYQTIGQSDKAVADLSKAIELNPKHASAWTNRGLAYLSLGQPDKAVADSSKAIELAPKEGTYWHTLGVAHYRAGDWKAAIAAIEKSVELNSEGEAVDRFFLAMSHWKLSNHDEARKQYEQALLWMDKNKAVLEKNKNTADELRRFQAEARDLLGIEKN